MKSLLPRKLWLNCVSRTFFVEDEVSVGGQEYRKEDSVVNSKHLRKDETISAGATLSN
jgi:hypothetical protein